MYTVWCTIKDFGWFTCCCGIRPRQSESKHWVKSLQQRKAWRTPNEWSKRILQLYWTQHSQVGHSLRQRQDALESYLVWYQNQCGYRPKNVLKRLCVIQNLCWGAQGKSDVWRTKRRAKREDRAQGSEEKAARFQQTIPDGLYQQRGSLAAIRDRLSKGTVQENRWASLWDLRSTQNRWWCLLRDLDKAVTKHSFRPQSFRTPDCQHAWLQKVHHAGHRKVEWALWHRKEILGWQLNTDWGACSIRWKWVDGVDRAAVDSSWGLPNQILEA